MSAVQVEPFRAAFRGRFSGVLRWEQLTEFWQRVRASESDWYIYAIGTEPPEQPADNEEMHKFLDEIDALLRKEHEEDFCGIVYVDDLEKPAFIKIFDPNNLGVVCGFSDDPPLPGWIMSHMPPIDLKSTAPLPGNRRRWWQRIFGA